MGQVSARDVHNQVTATEVVLPLLRTATVAGSAIDTADFREILVCYNVGTITDGTFTPNVTTSATSGGSYAADDAYWGTLTAATSAADDTCTTVSIDIPNLDNRYLKVGYTVTGSPGTGGTVGVTVIGFKKSFTS